MEWMVIALTTDVDGQRLCQRWCCRTICIRELCSDGVQKRKKLFFLLLRVLKKNYPFFLPYLLQRLFITWLQAQKHT
jgi:hypothetical protein